MNSNSKSLAELRAKIENTFGSSCAEDMLQDVLDCVTDRPKVWCAAVMCCGAALFVCKLYN